MGPKDGFLLNKSHLSIDSFLKQLSAKTLDHRNRGSQSLAASLFDENESWKGYFLILLIKHNTFVLFFSFISVHFWAEEETE